MLIISNEELNDFIKIVKSLEDFSLLTKGVNEAVENDAKNQKGCLGMLAATSAFGLWGNVLGGKGVTRAGKGTIRAGQGF